VRILRPDIQEGRRHGQGDIEAVCDQGSGKIHDPEEGGGVLYAADPRGSARGQPHTGQACERTCDRTRQAGGRGLHRPQPYSDDPVEEEQMDRRSKVQGMAEAPCSYRHRHRRDTGLDTDRGAVRGQPWDGLPVRDGVLRGTQILLPVCRRGIRQGGTLDEAGKGWSGFQDEIQNGYEARGSRKRVQGTRDQTMEEAQGRLGGGIRIRDEVEDRVHILGPEEDHHRVHLCQNDERNGEAGAFDGVRVQCAQEDTRGHTGNDRQRGIRCGDMIMGQSTARN